jgi:hypothetical protein
VFWDLLLAHLIADYPLQPGWMVRNKSKPWVLLLHAGVHFVVMAGVAWMALGKLWPYLAALAGAHLLIDAAKNAASRRRPDWVIGLYIVDQAVHIITLVLTSAWIARTAGAVQPGLDRPQAVYLAGYLLATYVWFISERILAYRNRAYQQEIAASLWSRMAVRAALLTVFLVIRQLPLLAFIPLGAILPYARDEYRRREVWSDILAAVTAALMVSVFAR